MSATQSSHGLVVGRRHRQSITAVALSSDDRRGFAVSKDGAIVEWDIERGLGSGFNAHSHSNNDGDDSGPDARGAQAGSHSANGGKSTTHTLLYPWPAPGAPSLSSRAAAGSVPEGSEGGKKGKGRAGGSKHLLALAVSSDGRYLAAGGYDRKVHVWDTRTRTHVRVSGRVWVALAFGRQKSFRMLFEASRQLDAQSGSHYTCAAWQCQPLFRPDRLSASVLSLDPKK